MTHFVDKWCILETNESVHDIAKRLIEDLEKNGISSKCITHGFRSEFDGVPVLAYSTGVYRQGIPLYHSTETYQLIEYAVIEKKGIIVSLGDYRGPAGISWTGSNRKVLEELFTGISKDKKKE